MVREYDSRIELGCWNGFIVCPSYITRSAIYVKRRDRLYLFDCRIFEAPKEHLT